MNIWDIIIICGVIALIILAVRLYRSGRKSGGCCGGGNDAGTCNCCPKNSGTSCSGCKKTGGNR